MHPTGAGDVRALNVKERSNMDLIWKIIPLWLKDRFHLTIWFLILCLILYNWLQSDLSPLIQAVEQISEPILAKIALTLLLLAVGLFASLIALSRKLHTKPNLKDYDYIENPGYYVHKTTKEKYCGNCIDKHDKLYHLSIHPEKGLMCRPCNNVYVPLKPSSFSKS
jgi:hypothetical protein